VTQERSPKKRRNISSSQSRKCLLDRDLTTHISYFCDDGSQFIVAWCYLRVREGIKEHCSTNLIIYTIPFL